MDKQIYIYAHKTKDRYIIGTHTHKTKISVGRKCDISAEESGRRGKSNINLGPQKRREKKNTPLCGKGRLMVCLTLRLMF